MAALKVSRSTVDSYIAEGCPIAEPAQGRGPGRANRFDLEAVRAWQKANGKTGRPGRPSSFDRVAQRFGTLLAELAGEGGDGPSGADLDIAKVRKVFAEAVLREMEVSKRRGELLEASEVEEGRLQRIFAVKREMEALPARLAPRLVGLEEPEIEAALREAVVGLLETFAGGAEPAPAAASAPVVDVLEAQPHGGALLRHRREEEGDAV